jgi:hypothetical protein
LNSSPIVKAFADSVLGLPSTAISDRPLRIEYCPVIYAARDGVQAGSTRNWVSRNPSRDLVEMWRRRAAQFATTVCAQVAVSDIVGEDEYYVGLLVLSQCRSISQR